MCKKLDENYFCVKWLKIITGIKKVYFNTLFLLLFKLCSSVKELRRIFFSKCVYSYLLIFFITCILLCFAFFHYVCTAMCWIFIAKTVVLNSNRIFLLDSWSPKNWPSRWKVHFSCFYKHVFFKYVYGDCLWHPKPIIYKHIQATLKSSKVDTKSVPTKKIRWHSNVR